MSEDGGFTGKRHGKGRGMFATSRSDDSDSVSIEKGNDEDFKDWLRKNEKVKGSVDGINGLKPKSSKTKSSSTNVKGEPLGNGNVDKTEEPRTWLGWMGFKT